MSTHSAPQERDRSSLQQLHDLMQQRLSTLPASPAVDACRYHLNTGGGLMRARLGLASASLMMSAEDALSAAMACEWLHNASLIHDDITDGEPLRRGQPTVCQQFGPGIALCAGDLMLTLAFTMTTEITDPWISRRIQKALTQLTQQVILAQSQELALTQTPETVSLQTYLQASTQKTAPLIELSLGLGLSESYSVAFHRFAQAIGLAYQILDDLDDVLAAQQPTASLHPLHAIHHHQPGSANDFTELSCHRALRHAQAALKRAEALCPEFPASLCKELQQLCASLYEHHHQLHTLCVQKATKALQTT